MPCASTFYLRATALSLALLFASAANAAIKAGVGVVDASGFLGASAGQYADASTGPGQTGNGGLDPQLYSTIKLGTYGIASRTSARAIVVEGSNGERVALITSDSYLAQDLVLRRTAQLLAVGSSGIRYEQLLHSASHNHSAPYQLTESAGVWVFQDSFNPIAFEQQARALATAVEKAVANLKPARMGATVVQHTIVKDNIVGPSTALDGTPAGYPRDFNDNDLTVLRFDDISDATPKPLAVWTNFGQHPEGLDGHHLVSGDFVTAMRRSFERATGAPLLFSQGDVGSSEGPYDRDSNDTLPDGIRRAWAHVGWAQVERAGYILAEAAREGFDAIGRGDASVRVPFTSDFPVGIRNFWTAGPLSHPYPSVSNCNSAQTFEGDVGVPIAGLPDCARSEDNGFPGLGDVFGPIFGNVPAGTPIPGHYDGPGHPAVEENQRLHLQTVRLGDVLLASCACEAQVDLILNLKSRANTITGDIWDGFDYACLLPENFSDPLCAVQNVLYAPTPARIAKMPGSLSDAAKVAHFRAQVHNDARGWDEPANVLAAQGSEPADITQIWGNFTKEELTPALGYPLVVGLGHSGDYNGYTVSYREYMSRDSYRKALTSYGPHTADFMVTRLVRMAGAMKGGPAVPADPLAAQASVDEQRQVAQATMTGQITSALFDGYTRALPDDAGSVQVLTQPADITRLQATSISWLGGGNSHDNPQVRVEREVAGGWQFFAGQQGEVQSFLAFPKTQQELLSAKSGQFEWRWTASFEAFDPLPRGIGQTPAGRYRFVIDGQRIAGGKLAAYTLTSAPFAVTPWRGVVVQDGQISAGSVSVLVPDSVYPRSYTLPGIAAIADDARTTVCRTCTFRPWAVGATAASVKVSVTRKNGARETIAASLRDGRWLADTKLALGDAAVIAVGDAQDAFGEINGEPLQLPAVTAENAAPTPPVVEPPPVEPPPVVDPPPVINPPPVVVEPPAPVDPPLSGPAPAPVVGVVNGRQFGSGATSPLAMLLLLALAVMRRAKTTA